MDTGRAWLVLTLGEDRQYAGNMVYADELDAVYRYDSLVPNSRQIVEGDLLILRDGEHVLGTARVSRLEAKEGPKQLSRCPVCNITALKVRKNKRPRYKCTPAGHEFEEPVVTQRQCLHYAAWFEGTFRRLTKQIAVKNVIQACPRYNGQLAMQELVLNQLEGEARVLLLGVAALSLVRRGAWLSAADASDEAYVPDLNDERTVIGRQIRERRGQQRFRQTLLNLFGYTCPVTRCQIADLLEAAHISPYRGDKDNHPSNGLLLRADIHTLFDLDLLGIEPGTLQLHVKPELKGSEYEDLGTRTLACESGQLSREALELRWQKFQSRPEK